jgi:shikimate kinase
MGLSLIGPRGAGKSTVGKKLAGMLRLEYVSIDAQIERTAGRPIPEIVAADGWVGFRLQEEAALTQAARAPGRLLDTGGGIVEVPGNRALLRRYGPVVWLSARSATLLARLAGSAERPALTAHDDPADEMAEVLARRDPFYRELADLAVSTEGKSGDEVAEEIVTWLRALSL